jgi:stage II sporulation protein M
MFTRHNLRLTWKEIRPYFIFSVMLFFAGMIVGGSDNSPTDWLDQQMQGISQISDTVNKSDNPELTMFIFIAANNIFKSILAMGLGIVVCLLPLFMLVTNGMIIGYLLTGFADKGQNVTELVVKGLLPHGILELSALFLACAFGIRFGLTLIKGIYGSLLGKSDAWASFVRTAKGAIPALIVVTVMLIIAAIVESTVTYWLMS